MTALSYIALIHNYRIWQHYRALHRLLLIFFALSALGIRAGKPISKASINRKTALTISFYKLESAVCHKRKNCKLVQVTPAGKDDAKRKITIAEVLAAQAQMPDLGSSDGVSELPNEFWLIASRGTSLISRQLLFFRPSGNLQKNMFYLDGNFMTYPVEEREGRNCINFKDYQFTLSPLHFVYENTSSGECGKTDPQYLAYQNWNWDKFTGKGEWGNNYCDSEGHPWDPDKETHLGSLNLNTSTLIPMALTGTEYQDAGWRTTSLGGCSLFVNGSHDFGFTTYGMQSSLPDSSFRAVLTLDRTLFVEILDDRFVGPSPDWVNEDHLEIWLSTEDRPEARKCFAMDHTPELVQYGIRLIDGTVFPAFGHPKELLTVERAEGTDAEDKPVVRLKIKLPEFKAITVVYSDSDDGKSQKRLIATSPLKFGKRLTLGGVYEINPKDATCAVKDGKLEPVMTPKTYKWDEPVIGQD